MGKYTKIGNIFRGADASTGANRARATENAARRYDAVADAGFDDLTPVLLQPEVLASLPRDLAAKIELGDRDAVMEGVLRVLSSGRVPQSIPADMQIARNNFPDGNAGFQMGRHGGRVPTDSAGELIVSENRSLVRNPGAEAGFRLQGDLPPQDFDPTEISVVDARPIAVREMDRRRPGFNPLGTALGAGATLAAGKVIYDAASRGNDSPGVDVIPESRDDGASQEEGLPELDQQMTELQSTATRILDGLRKGPRSPQSDPYGGRLPPRKESELWATQGERSMDYALDPNSPQGRTLATLLDAGIEPERAEGIARGVVSMTQMERDAVINKGAARKQRTQDGIDARRRSRMGAY